MYIRLNLLASAALNAFRAPGSTAARRWWSIVGVLAFTISTTPGAESDPAHCATNIVCPLPWPKGIIPYDVSALAQDQQATVRKAMQRWMDTGARIAFVPRTVQPEYVRFTGKTDAGNNTSQTGFKPGGHADINITAFWWRQGEWMPAHELGHVLGFHHEHARWDRDAYVTIHYENIKPGRAADYDWIPRTNWLVSATGYDYYSIMHYRVCWASSCESQCHDGDGSSPCAVIDPVGKDYDRVIGQWTDNGISAADAERTRQAYGIGRTVYVVPRHSGGGAGTLPDPYGDLAVARKSSSVPARLVVFSAAGTFTIQELDSK